MKILFLSFYYQPDLSAGSFRASALINALMEQLPKDSHIDLITTLPNRYSSFSSEAPKLEFHSKLTINRVSLPQHKSGILDQSRAFLIFAKYAVKLCKHKEYDIIFATSSRLMTGVLGAYISRKLKKPLYLDLRDIFVDTIKDALPKKIVWALRPIFSLVERWTIHSSNSVNLVSLGFLPYFQKRYPNQNYSFFTNGIDDEFINKECIGHNQSNSKILKVVYAGNIGEGQGLHTIIPYLGKKFTGLLEFKLIGDGGRKEQLVAAIEKIGCKNVEILPPIKREELIKIYQSADILFLHLNDYEAFEKVLPSKLFEYGAMGKPIWAGVSGHAAKFINENITNSAIFRPCDIDGAVSAFDRLEIITKQRYTFVHKFNRRNIMKKMALDIIYSAKR
ncbi:glycosyltransferase family 4 protein [Alphaproteobacteria bacterium]|nr:glycosyltransferase family 4 protein [Alphaproteobacteria bacterium]